MTPIRRRHSRPWVPTRVLQRLLLFCLAPRASEAASVSRERRVLADGLDEISDHGTWRGPTPLRLAPIIEPQVALECVEAAHELAVLLRDPRTVVSTELARDIRRFLTDGCESPLFGRSPQAAFRAVAELEQRARSR